MKNTEGQIGKGLPPDTFPLQRRSVNYRQCRRTGKGAVGGASAHLPFAPVTPHPPPFSNFL